MIVMYKDHTMDEMESIKYVTNERRILEVIIRGSEKSYPAGKAPSNFECYAKVFGGQP